MRWIHQDACFMLSLLHLHVIKDVGRDIQREEIHTVNGYGLTACLSFTGSWHWYQSMRIYFYLLDNNMLRVKKWSIQCSLSRNHLLLHKSGRIRHSYLKKKHIGLNSRCVIQCKSSKDLNEKNTAEMSTFTACFPLLNVSDAILEILSSIVFILLASSIAER